MQYISDNFFIYGVLEHLVTLYNFATKLYLLCISVILNTIFLAVRVNVFITSMKKDGLLPWDLKLIQSTKAATCNTFPKICRLIRLRYRILMTLTILIIQRIFLNTQAHYNNFLLNNDSKNKVSAISKCNCKSLPKLFSHQ